MAPSNKREQRRDRVDDEAEEAVEDVADFFTAKGPADSPESDADAPPPG
jgi:hypothetical protein